MSSAAGCRDIVYVYVCFPNRAVIGVLSPNKKLFFLFYIAYFSSSLTGVAISILVVAVVVLSAPCIANDPNVYWL